MGAGGLAAGSNTQMDCVDSEQRGHDRFNGEWADISYVGCDLYGGHI